MNISLLHLQQIVALTSKRSYAKAGLNLSISLPELNTKNNLVK
jgi:hypothetical protein